MPWWEAINHGMTGLSTGGFAVTDNSIGDYEPLIRLVVIFVMILGAVSFAVHYRVLSEGRLSALWKDSQHRMLWVLLGLGSGALVLENIWWPGEFHWVDSVFQWVSALGTAGFQTIDLHRIPQSCSRTMGFDIADTFGSNIRAFKGQTYQFCLSSGTGNRIAMSLSAMIDGST